MSNKAVARHRNAAARGGFTMLENVVLFDVRVTALALRLYAALKHFAWKNGGEIPGQKELAESIGTTDRSVREAFKNLEAARLVTVERTQGTASVVWIEEPAPEESSGEQRKKLPVGTPPSPARAEDLEDSSPTESALAPGEAVDKSVDAVEQRSKRGRVYDALVEACYPEGATLTAKEKRKVGIAAVEIDRANGTAEDVVERVARYRAHVTYGGVALTAMSLANHWAELAPPGAKRTTAPCPECEVGGGMHSADCSRATSK